MGSSFGLDNTDLKALASANKVEVRIDNLAYTRKNLAELIIKGTPTGITEFKRMVDKMLQVKEMGQCNLETSSSKCTRPKCRYIHDHDEKNYSTASSKNRTFSNSNIEGFKSDREKENNKAKNDRIARIKNTSDPSKKRKSEDEDDYDSSSDRNRSSSKRGRSGNNKDHH